MEIYSLLYDTIACYAIKSNTEINKKSKTKTLILKYLHTDILSLKLETASNKEGTEISFFMK